MRQHADDHLALGFVVDVDEGDAARAGLEHASAGFVEGFERMDGHGFDGGDAQGALDVAKAVEFELVDLREGVRVLPVVLYDVQVVGCGE